MSSNSTRRRTKLPNTGTNRSRSASRSVSRSRSTRASSQRRGTRAVARTKQDDASDKIANHVNASAAPAIAEPEKTSAPVSDTEKGEVKEIMCDLEEVQKEGQNGHVGDPSGNSLTANQFGVEEKDIPSGVYAYEHLPRYLRDNPHILSGYRISYSFLDSVKSLFTCHNEFMNVWSHLGACIFFLIMLLFFVSNYSSMHAIESTHHYISGYAPHLDRGALFIKDMFTPAYKQDSGKWTDYVSTYHESMPTFCRRYYDRYSAFMKAEGLALNDEMPRNRFVDGELVLGPWDFPSQCKPLTKKIYSPSLAEKLRGMLSDLDEDFRTDQAKLKKKIGQVFSHVPLSSSFRNVPLPDVSNVDLDSVKSALRSLYTKMQDSVTGTQEQANEAYLTLRDALLPVAKQLEVDPRALKHPLFLLNYLDLSSDSKEQLEIYPIVLYILCAMFCFTCSAIYHLVGNMSYEMHLMFGRVDYSGISQLIGGSGYAMVHYLFKCYPIWQTVYGVLLVTLSLLTFIITVLPRFSGLKFRAARVYLFIGLGCCGVLPFAHKVALDGMDLSTLFYLVSTGALYIGGAFIYITRFPEVLFPGKCDQCCHSHTIWHLFVVAGALTHLLGIMYLFNTSAILYCENKI